MSKFSRTSQGQTHQENASLRRIIAVEKLSSRCSSSPKNDARRSVEFGFVDLSNECWNDVRTLQVVIIIGTIQIGWHRSDKAGAVLTVIGRTHFDSTYLGESIRTV